MNGYPFFALCAGLIMLFLAIFIGDTFGWAGWLAVAAVIAYFIYDDYARRAPAPMPSCVTVRRVRMSALYFRIGTGYGSSQLARLLWPESASSDGLRRSDIICEKREQNNFLKLFRWGKAFSCTMDDLYDAVKQAILNRIETRQFCSVGYKERHSFVRLQTPKTNMEFHRSNFTPVQDFRLGSLGMSQDELDHYRAIYCTISVYVERGGVLVQLDWNTIRKMELGEQYQEQLLDILQHLVLGDLEVLDLEPEEYQIGLPEDYSNPEVRLTNRQVYNREEERLASAKLAKSRRFDHSYDDYY